MSEQSSTTLKPSLSQNERRDGLSRRWGIYAALAVLAVLTLAYFDAGEEPLHPITQPVALSGGEA